MISIRRNVFETNSSSTHSLVILTNDAVKEISDDTYFTHDEMLNSLNWLKNGIYKSYERDWYFGREPFRVLDTFELKFQYAYANANDDEKFELVSMLKELVPEVKKFIPPVDSGVDEYRLHGWLNMYNVTLRDFLTCKKYIVIQDGDEYCIWTDLIKSGLIDTNIIENMEDQ